jgi:hypothetical protein
MRKTIATSMAVLMGLSLLACIQPADAKRVDQVDNRFERQSERITNGVDHKKMNAGEQTRRDEADYRMENEQQNMRNRHGGKLTRGDQRRLNRQLNRNSRKIHRDKHN